MLKNLPFWGQLVLVAVLAGGAIFVAQSYYPNFSATSTEIAELKTQHQGKEDKIREGQAIEAQLPEFEREIASLKQKLEDLKQILPTEAETGDLLKWIKNLAD